MEYYERKEKQVDLQKKIQSSNMLNAVRKTAFQMLGWEYDQLYSGFRRGWRFSSIGMTMLPVWWMRPRPAWSPSRGTRQSTLASSSNFSHKVGSTCCCPVYLERRPLQISLPRALSVAWASASHPLSPSRPGFGWAGWPIPTCFDFSCFVSLSFFTERICEVDDRVPDITWTQQRVIFSYILSS